MKRGFFQTCALAALGGVLLAGCSSTASTEHKPVVVSPTGEIFVRENPPPPRAEDVGLPPRSGEEWVQGYWTFQNGSWIWMPGHWETPPQHGQTWVAGHWDRTERGWVYTPGHWE